MRIYCNTLLVASLGMLVSCGNGGNSSNSSRESRADSLSAVSVGKPTQLPFPEVPPEYDTPEKRITYVLNVYWDGLDFTDRSLSLDTVFMEQSFSNFISLLRYEQNAAPPMTHLVENAAADTLATIFLWNIADKYLNDPNSPMRNGELYRTFLQALGRSPVITDDYREKLIYQQGIANLNRPGFVANDFRFVSRKGVSTSLLESAKGEVTLLMFYDPDCESCKGIMRKISETKLPEGLRVIAIDAEDDRELWKSTADSFPDSWIVGFATDDVQGEPLYHLPAMPTIYLLDKDGKVLLKDPSAETALSAAASILGKRIE